MKANDADLLAALKRSFAKVPKPEDFFEADIRFRERYLKQFIRLEGFNWDTGRPSDLATIYEPNTFISKDAYKYLIPRVFSFIERNSEDVLYLDCY